MIDKVFAVRSDWAEANPETLQALLRALIRAARWAEAPANLQDLAALLAGPAYLGQPQALIHRSLNQDRVAFARMEGLDVGLASADDARWLLTDMIDAGQVEASAPASRLAEAMMRPDLYAQALAGLDL